MRRAQVQSVAASPLVPANPGVLDGSPDLTGLTYLNEPAILHGLHVRYGKDAIYTHAGRVLIALNPFRRARSPAAWGFCERARTGCAPGVIGGLVAARGRACHDAALADRQ